MGMSVDFFARILGMIALAALGGSAGTRLARFVGAEELVYEVVFGLIGALAGLVLTPYFTTRPVRALRRQLARVSAQVLLAGLTGLIVGLIVAALVAFPLSMLPDPLGSWLPFGGAVLFGYLGVAVFVMRQNDLFAAVRWVFHGSQSEDLPGEGFDRQVVLLDTSVLIDGRVVDIARTGFLPGILLVPRFVIQELQHIADSPDPLRRQRGRRGIDVLNDLLHDPLIPARLTDLDVREVREVDEKLMVLARQMRCPILTTDYNLARVAEVQGVRVLNINELANAVKAVYLPGEALLVEIIQPGKEPDQGVAYLEDGTMIVVEEGQPYIGQRIEVVVTKALQTAAGRMLFARPRVNGDEVSS